jgi:transcription antitermination protein NusB
VPIEPAAASIPSLLLMFRHKARACALQMLFQWDMGQQPLAKIEKGFWKTARGEMDVRAFANQLFESAVAQAAGSDTLVAKFSQNRRPERISTIDRSILRLAIAELTTTDAPPNVVLDEALVLAKKFSSPESASFLNGILDAIFKSLQTK